MKIIAHKGNAAYLLKMSAILSRERAKPKEYTPTMQLLKTNENSLYETKEIQQQVNMAIGEFARMDALKQKWRNKGREWWYELKLIIHSYKF